MMTPSETAELMSQEGARRMTFGRDSARKSQKQPKHEKNKSTEIQELQ